MVFKSIRRLALVFAFCLLAAAGAAMTLAPEARATEPSSSHRSSGGGGPSVGIGVSIDIGRLIQQSRRKKQPQKKTPRVVTQPRGCKKPLVYSKRSRRCVCPSGKGYVMHRGKCVPNSTPQIVVDVPHIQECLTKAGYDPGPADGKAGRNTMQAFGNFQQANDLGNRPNALSDKQSVDRLFEICDAPDYGLAKVLSEFVKPEEAGKENSKPVEGATVLMQPEPASAPR